MENYNVRELTQKIYQSRLRIFKKYSFFGVFLSAFQFSLDNTIDTFSTDGEKIYYGPEYLKSLSDFEIDLTILHSLMHVILHHPYRYHDKLDNKLFHHACDIVVNSNIMNALNRTDDLYIQGRKLVHKCPNGDEGYLHTVEEVYSMLSKVSKRIKKNNEQNNEDESEYESPDQMTTSDDDMPVNVMRKTVPILKVKTDYSGSLYLKQDIYCDYKYKISWLAIYNPYQSIIVNPEGFLADKFNTLNKDLKHVEIELLDDFDDGILPVASYPSKTTTSMFVENDTTTIESDGFKDYTVECYPNFVSYGQNLDELKNTSFSNNNIKQEEQDYSKFVHDKYTKVDKGTTKAYRNILLKLLQDAGVLFTDPDIVKKARNIIATSFKYDCNYKRPGKDEDFLCSFLTKEKKGVCSQFATALILLLRFLNIPSRFVTGYATKVKSDTETLIYREQAHAWVEYYVDGTGWVLIDPTPVTSNSNGDGSGKGKSKNKDENGDFGSTIDSNKKWEKNKDEKTNQMKEDEIDNRILQSAENIDKNKNFGTIPASIKIIIDKLKNPLLDWRVLLYDFIEEEIVDYSFCPPDKRYSECDFVLPDLNETDETVKEILFMVDVSGSMSFENIQDCFSEIQGALTQFNGKITGTIGFFDAEIHETFPIEPDTNLKDICPTGQGGTCFQAVFDYVKEQENKPSSIIILSDGYCDFPDEEETQEIPLLWVINNEEVTPPYGRVVRLLNKEEE